MTHCTDGGGVDDDDSDDACFTFRKIVLITLITSLIQ